MVSRLDNLFQNLAPRLVNISPTAGVYKQDGGGTYNAVTGKVDGGSEAVYQVQISPPHPNRSRFDQEHTDTRGDMESVLPAKDLPFTPGEGDRLVVGQTEWRVVRVEPIYSGALIAAYTLGLER